MSKKYIKTSQELSWENDPRDPMILNVLRRGVIVMRISLSEAIEAAGPAVDRYHEQVAMLESVNAQERQRACRTEFKIAHRSLLYLRIPFRTEFILARTRHPVQKQCPGDPSAGVCPLVSR